MCKGTAEAQKQYALRFFIAMEKGRPGFNLHRLQQGLTMISVCVAMRIANLC